MVGSGAEEDLLLTLISSSLSPIIFSILSISTLLEDEEDEAAVEVEEEEENDRFA